MRIIYLGTPLFATLPLRALAKEHEIIAVVSQPDRAKDKKGRLIGTPVKEVALELGLPVYQFSKIRIDGLQILRDLAPDIMITCAYGQILSKEILEIAPHGVVNIHASLLPKYRGSSPIQWSIINGESVTGVTIMQTDVGIDNGDILLAKAVEIAKNDNETTMFDKLSVVGAQLIMEFMDKLERGEITGIKQNESESTHFPMLSKLDGKIKWQASSVQISHLTRGIIEWPTAYTTIDGEVIKIYQCEPCESELDGECGEIVAVKNNALIVKCGDGYLAITELQLSGKKRLLVKDFLLGKKISVGTILGIE